MVPTVVVKPGHVQPIWAGHPWVFAQAVERVQGGAEPGGEVEVVDGRGNVLGRGLYSPRSAIRVRLFTRGPNRPIDAETLAGALGRAVERRSALGLPSPDTDAYRLVHAEGDDLPGLVVDRYGSDCVVQFGTIGIKQREHIVYEALTKELAPRAIVDASSPAIAKREGFQPDGGVARGDTDLRELRFTERGLKFAVPLDLAQKTGFYLDQRPLRARVEALAANRDVLDCYSYVGAVALSAARGGAKRVEAVDSSALAIEVAAENAELNGLSGRVSFRRGEAIEALHHAGRHGGFDLVICDPPKLAARRSAKEAALKMTRRVAAGACQATKPGGLLLLSSCSAAINLADLTRSAALGARDVGTRPLVLERLFQGPDHPVPAAFPEGLYLSSLLLQVIPL
jgi:23S rRNA (cytosine1962-C5)-methyltransferase